MAITTHIYNHTSRLVLNKGIDLANLKVMLLNDNASFSAANTTVSQVTNAGANEVSGSGWTPGGVTLANVAVGTVATNNANLTADNVSVTADGGSIGPAYYALVLDATSNAPLILIDFDGAQSAGNGTPFNINWHSDGILVVENNQE
jgi:hypothetical protein